MAKLDKRKQNWISNAPTEVLQRVLDNTVWQQNEEPSTKAPLVGLIHMEGIGQLPLSAIRAEVERRSASAQLLAMQQGSVPRDISD